MCVYTTHVTPQKHLPNKAGLEARTVTLRCWRAHHSPRMLSENILGFFFYCSTKILTTRLIVSRFSFLSGRAKPYLSNIYSSRRSFLRFFF